MLPRGTWGISAGDQNVAAVAAGDCGVAAEYDVWSAAGGYRAAAGAAGDRSVAAGLGLNGRAQKSKIHGNFAGLQKRIQRANQEPLAILTDLELRRRNIVHMPQGVETKVAPPYLTHIYSKNGQAAEYFADFFTARRLSSTPLAQEAGCLAGVLDDALYTDGIDLFSSAAIERIARRLYSLELGLKDVRSASDLDTKANWQLADQYDLTFLEHQRFSVERADSEVRKRLARKAALKKCLAQALTNASS